MITTLETSLPGTISVIASSFEFSITQAHAAFRRVYNEGDLASITVLSEETYRHGGKAVIGAVVGTLLTGGVGFLAGAAIGGRRRQEAVYIVLTRDGQNIVLRSRDKAAIARLQLISAKLELSKTHPQTQIETPGPPPPPSAKKAVDLKEAVGTQIDPDQDRNRISITMPQPQLDPVMLAMLNLANQRQKNDPS